jgi:hypothetical protein
MIKGFLACIYNLEFRAKEECGLDGGNRMHIPGAKSPD